MSEALPPAATANTRITIYVSGELDQRIRAAADEAGQSLSVWMVRAARAALREQERE
jgi:uncharacterized protein (DUF1778 family)